MIGEKIKKAIESSGIPIRQVALKIEMSEQNLYKTFKRDTIETKTLLKICELLGVASNYFLTEDVGLDSIEARSALVSDNKTDKKSATVESMQACRKCGG